MGGGAGKIGKQMARLPPYLHILQNTEKQHLFSSISRNSLYFHQQSELVYRPKRTHDIMGGMEYMIWIGRGNGCRKIYPWANESRTIKMLNIVCFSFYLIVEQPEICLI